MNTKAVINLIGEWGEVVDEIISELDRLSSKQIMEGTESLTEEEKGQLKLLRHLSGMLYK